MNLYGVIKIRTICKDKATGSKGMVTHIVIDMSQKVNYIFQPEILNDEGHPTPSIYMDNMRLDAEDYENLGNLPLDILGSKVTDNASGFTGMATELIMHPNGCFHVNIQPKGTRKDGNLIKPKDFDIRQCSGSKIPKQTEVKKEESRKQQPSPASMPERPFP